MRPLILLFALTATACLSTSPEEERRNRLGVGDECESLGPEGPEHCPGSPCLACHSESFHPDTDATFILAGTVYDYVDDPAGRERITVSFVDADLRPFTALTNRTGNFMISVDEGGRMREDDRGHTTIPFRPRFPLSVGVVSPELGRNMRSYIWREGSCAVCHSREDGASATGQVYVRVRE